MLTKIIFKNFKSFKNKTIIDLNMKESELLKESNTYNGVLKGVSFFGSNSTGKTGALLTIKLLLDLLFSDETIDYANYKYLNNKQDMMFEYHFKFDKKEFKYYLVLNDKIKEEKLIINNNEYYLKKNRDNLYLKELKEDSEVIELYSYLKNSISFNVSLFSKDETTYDLLYEYLNNYGVSEINEFLNKYHFPYLIEYDGKLYFIRVNGKIEFSNESYGNKMLMNLLAMFNLIFINKGILLIDEFSNSLHNKLEELIIKYFFSKSKGSQIMFVSHSTNLLKLSLLRLDQIYIVDMDEDGSKIKRLSNENIRPSQNLEKMYLSGMFGGVPLYDPFE